MTVITSASAMGLVTAICQLIAVIWLVWLCLRSLMGTVDVPGFLRGLLVVVMIGQILPAITGAFRPSAASDGQPIIAAYQQMAEALGGTMPGTAAPGQDLVARSVDLSAGIWSGIVTSGLIFLPVIAWMVVVAVDLMQGTPLPALAIRLLFWWLLWSICVGGVGTTLSRATYQLATAVAQSAIAGVQHAQAQAPAAPPAAWSIAEIVAAATVAELPPALATITAPLVHSIQRVLPPDSSAYQRFAENGFIGALAQSSVRGMYLISAYGADPHASFSQEYPSLDPLLSHTITPTVYLNAPDLDAWVARAFVDDASAVIDGAGMVVGVVPIGDCPALGQALATAYAALAAGEVARVTTQLAALPQGHAGDLANTAWTAVLHGRLTRLAGFHAPTVAVLTTAPLAMLVAARYQSYYAAVLAQTPDLITAHRTAHADAWGVLCLVSGSGYWPPASSGTALPSDPFARLVCAAPMRSAMEAPPLNPADRTDGGHGDQVIGRLFAYLVQLLVDSSLSVAYLVFAAVVWLLAPLVVHLGFYLIALGCFILNLAYPVAAFLSLFPRQSMLLIEWAKAVFWVALWIPFIVIGISLATPRSASDVIAPLMSLTGHVVGGALGGMAASAASGPGTVTGAYITMLTGIVMILMSWWFANVMLNPGLAGISSAMRWMAQASTGLVAAAAGGSGLVAQGLAQGVRAAGRAAGVMAQEAARADAASPAAPAPDLEASIMRTGRHLGQTPGSGGWLSQPSPGMESMRTAWDRMRAATAPSVAAAAVTAAAGGSFADALVVIDTAVQDHATAAQRSPGARRLASHASRRAPPSTGPLGIRATGSPALPPSPAEGLSVSGDAARDAAHAAGLELGRAALAGMPMSSQREPALRWLAQAEQATTSAGAAECAGAALDCALRSGDWAMRGRAAGLVRRTAASASASAFSAADRPGAEGGGASAPRLGESLGIADAVGEHMAGAFSQRVHALGLPTYTGICITAEGTPLDCAARALQAGTALDASERQLRTGQSAAAMASATLGATQALRSGDAGLIGRADAQVLTAAGAVMELGSLDPGYEHAVVSAERGLHLMAAHRVAMAGPGRRAATRTVPAETSPSVTAPHPMGGDHG